VRVADLAVTVDLVPLDALRRATPTEM